MHPSTARSYAHGGFSRRCARRGQQFARLASRAAIRQPRFWRPIPQHFFVNFDLPTYPWNRTARAYHRSRYGPRLEVIDGNSLVTIREFSQRKPTPSCDMVVVDGMHDYVHPLLDILGLLTFAPCNASIVMDDVCDPRRCHAHFIGRRDLGSGANNHVVIGPTQAWREAIRTGHVREVVAYNEPATGGAFDRGWALGEHVCDRHGERTRPRRRYSYTPVMVTFQPNHPSGEQSARDTKQRAVAKDLWGEAQPTKRCLFRRPPSCPGSPHSERRSQSHFCPNTRCIHTPTHFSSFSRFTRNTPRPSPSYVTLSLYPSKRAAAHRHPSRPHNTLLPLLDSLFFRFTCSCCAICPSDRPMCGSDGRPSYTCPGSPPTC